MKTKIICKELKRGTLTFYTQVNGKDYYLFQQEFKKTVFDFFKKGVILDGVNDYSSSTSPVVRKTLDKLPTYVRYAEKEYDIEVYEKTKRAKNIKKSRAYKRQSFRWRDYAWAI